MSLYGALSASTLGMMSQSYALNIIGQNVANVTTGGYKRNDIGFETVLSDNLFNQRDLGGTKPNTLQRISAQGQLQGTKRDLDLAINGRGFFIMSDNLMDTSSPIYTRDGSFQIRVENQAFSNDPSGQTNGAFATDEGYIVDKNGFYLLGVPAAADGSFTSANSPQPMRIDQNTFSSTFQTTTAAELNVNLPSTNTTLGTLPANANPPAIPITQSASARHLAAVTSLNDGTQVDGLITYNIEVVDSAGKLQPVRLNFTKDADNSWLVSATTTRTPVAQVDTITFADTGTGGTIEAGDQFDVTVGTQTYTYTATGAEANIDAVRDALVALINTPGDANVTAAVSTVGGTLTLTAKTAGEPFTSAAAVTEPPAVAQVDTLTLGGVLEAGDSYTVTVNATPFTVTVPTPVGATTLTTLRDALVAQINADGALPVTAAPGAAGVFTLTADTAGTPFTATPVPVNAGIAVNTFTRVATTANVSQDNTATRVVTTANVLPLQTNTPQDLDFTDTGLAGVATAGAPNGVTPPTPMTFNIGFQATPADSTASFTLDFSATTQYAGDFTPNLYTRDGFATATLTNITFDSKGHVVGEFDDLTFRNLYKIPLADFTNADGLMEMNGMTFKESPTSGEARFVFVDNSQIATFATNTVELSNVDIADEFTKMIITQNAYNTNATVFRTVDEMTEVVRDLKR